MTLMFTAQHIGLYKTIHRLCLQANMYVGVSFMESDHSMKAFMCCVRMRIYV